MHKIKKNEYIVINKSNITARVIEIYAIPREFDRIFLINYADGAADHVFESQTTPLDRLSRPSSLRNNRTFPLPTF